MGEVLTLKDAVTHRQAFQGKVVFTNGVFDIIHRGHIEYLSEAKKLGDILIVGVNSDESARSLGKGSGRPFQNQSDRAFIVSHLIPVDIAVIFDQSTPWELINALQPDVLVKGGDYQIDEIVGRDIVESRGGEVVTISLTPGMSTSSIIDKIRESSD